MIRLVGRLALPVLYALDALVAATVRTQAPGDQRTIVFVRTDKLGNMVMWLAAARALTDHFRQEGARTVLVAGNACAGLPVISQLFDHVIPIDTGRFRTDPRYRWATVRRLARIQADCVVNPTMSRDSLGCDSVARAIRAPRKFAFPPRPDPFPRVAGVRDQWYTDPIAMPADLHELDHAARAAACLIGAPLATIYPSIPPPCAPGATPVPNGPARYAVLAPACASSPLRAWPGERFARVAEHLYHRHALRSVFIGMPAERAAVAAAAAGCRTPVVNLAGETDQATMGRLMAGAELVIANETGAGHLAAAFGVPTVMIVGGGHFGRCMPYPPDGQARPMAAHVAMDCYGCNWQCTHRPAAGQPAPCVTAVETHQVLDAVDRLVAENRGTRPATQAAASTVATAKDRR